MPSVRVLGNPFPLEQKRELGRLLAADLKRVLKVPIGEVFFEEFDEYYVDFRGFSIHDGNDEPGAVTLVINGPAREQAVLQELCAALTSSVRSVAGKPDFEVTTVYHVITGDYIGTNGMIHSLSGKGQPKGAKVIL